MEVQCLGGEVGSGGGHHFRHIGHVGGQGETHLYEIIILTKPRRRHTLLLEKA